MKINRKICPKCEGTKNRSSNFCKKCYHTRKHDTAIEELKKILSNKNLLLMDIEYKGTLFKYSIKCLSGHIYKAVIGNVKKGHRCPECNLENQRNTKEEIDMLGKEHGVLFLGTEYKNNKTKYPWKCIAKGHVIHSRFNDIQQGCGCIKCAGLERKTIEYCRKIAKERHNGKCLSKIYKNSKTKLEWKCEKKHIFDTKPCYVFRGSWCPHCARLTSKAELEIYEYVKQRYPQATNNKTGILKNKMFKLDVHIPNVNKAIEYDGEWSHYSEWALSKGHKERDARKDKECEEAGIKLLRIREKDYQNNKEETLEIIFRFLDNSS